MGEGREDPQTKRVRPQRCTARGRPSRDLGSHIPGVPPSSLAGRLPCRPALLRTCSAASGSRCGSSSGTVNWIFRGLLSGSMAGRRPPLGSAAGGREGGGTRGWGGRAHSPLLSAPAPAPARRAQLPAPGSAFPARVSGDSVAADWLRTRPSGPPFPPAARSLNPVVAAPPAAGVPVLRAGEQGAAGPQAQSTA